MLVICQALNCPKHPLVLPIPTLQMEKLFSKQRENPVYVQGQSHTLVFKPRHILNLTFHLCQSKAKRIYKRRRKMIIDTKSRFVDNLTLWKLNVSQVVSSLFSRSVRAEIMGSGVGQPSEKPRTALTMWLKFCYQGQWCVCVCVQGWRNWETEKFKAYVVLNYKFNLRIVVQLSKH